jgi:hypothetical protein
MRDGLLCEKKTIFSCSGCSSPNHDGSKNWKNNIEYTYYKTINIIYFYPFKKLSTQIRLKMCNVYLYESISSCAQYATLCKKLSHPSSMYSFTTPPIKLKLVQQIGGELLIANHLDKSLWWANQKHWATVRSYLLYFFVQGWRCSDTVSTLSLCFKLWSKEVHDQTLNPSMKQTSC